VCGVKYYSILACLVGLAALAVLTVLVWAEKLHLGVRPYRCARTLGVVLISMHAAVAVWRLTRNVALQALDPKFIPELIGYLAFWLLFPPLWFFLEYYAVDSGAIDGVPRAEADMKRMKDYTDLASKVWAAVIAILVGLVALKR
jgi:H+/Cl- antiporter ClcA